MVQHPSSKLASVAIGTLLAVTACGGGGGGAPAGGADHSGLTGSVNIEGSSTVFPITDAVKFDWEGAFGDGVVIALGREGTTAGFEQFCAGETDIADASRPIKETEAEACAAAGVEFVELEIALDGLTVMVHPSNPLDCVSQEDLYALIGPEAQGIESWGDAQRLASELGSDTQFPELPLFLTGPGQESGTFGSFVELALDPVTEVRFEQSPPPAEVTEEKGLIRDDYVQSGDDETIVNGIEENDGSLGWVGFAFAQGAGEGVKEVAVKDGSGACVAPTAGTIADGSYPLSRSLYIYVSAASAAKPEVVAFVDFYLAGLGGFVDAGGYVQLPDDRVAATNDAWAAAKA